jgi:AcrR family transcriptional regulator
LDAARQLFGSRGYADTSLDDVARTARVTKGALYHHYAGKQQLFEAVVEELSAEEVSKLSTLSTLSRAGDSSWDVAVRGLDAALDTYLDPIYQRIVLQDGPTVLGMSRWTALEQRYGLGLVRALVEGLIADGTLRPAPADLVARVILAAESQIALAIVEADDPEAVRAQARALLVDLMSGLRTDRPGRPPDGYGGGAPATREPPHAPGGRPPGPAS